MSMRVIAEARSRTREIFESIEDRRAGFGEDFLGELEKSYLKIEQNPHRYPRLTVPSLHERDLRQIFVRRFPINIIYEIRGAEILVLALIDQTNRNSK